MQKEAIKSLVELSESIEEADHVIIKFTSCRTLKQKLDYLYETFNVSILGSLDAEYDENTDYQALLSTIINKKWR